MSNKTLIDQIRHYQKDIERSPDNAERVSFQFKLPPNDPGRDLLFSNH